MSDAASDSGSASGVPSPLGLFLRHARQADASATEVLILTFNHDLGYFEKAALGPIQATGARISVLADARVAHHDLVAVRRAGTAYLPGLAHCSGAFHPKLLVIGADGAATVAIGSGNLSMAGWQGNDELWSVHHASAETGSSVIGDVAIWLAGLSERVTLSHGAGTALNRVAELLTPLGAPPDDVSFVSSLDQPIIEQLPGGPVDELCVVAPFHDPGAVALSGLVQRFAPKRIVVGYQPGLTRIDGEAVAGLLTGRGKLVQLKDDPYRHGKLIEWLVDGQRWALTGSPNISGAALLKSVEGGGNVEIGVIAPIRETLVPKGDDQDIESLRSVAYLSSVRTRPAIVLLSAALTANGFELRLARPLSDAAMVELSPIDLPPDEWHEVGTVPSGLTECAFVLPVFGGGRIRLRTEDGRSSSTVFLIDPDRVLRTRASRPIGARLPDVVDVFTDPKAAEQFYKLAAQLDATKAGPGARPAGVGSTQAGVEARSSGYDAGDWEDYLDRCRDRLSLQTITFALGLPPAMALASAVDATVRDAIDWDDELIDENEVGGLDEDNTEELAEVSAAAEDTRLVTPQLRRATEQVRKRYRTFAENVTRRWADAEPLERLTGLRMVLCLVAGGAWGEADRSWIPLVLAGASGLAADEALSSTPELERASGSLIALSMSVARSSLPQGERSVAHNTYDRTAKTVAHLLVAADRSVVEAYGEGLEERFPVAAQAETAMAVAEALVADDPLERAVDELAEHGIVARLRGAVLDLPTPVSDPRFAALHALALAEKAPIVAIRAHSSKNWVTVLWRKPDVAIIQNGAKPGTMLAMHYSLTSGARPSDYAARGALNPDHNVETSFPGGPLLSVATELLHAVGLDAPGPPA